MESGNQRPSHSVSLLDVIQKQTLRIILLITERWSRWRIGMDTRWCLDLSWGTRVTPDTWCTETTWPGVTASCGTPPPPSAPDPCRRRGHDAVLTTWTWILGADGRRVTKMTLTGYWQTNQHQPWTLDLTRRGWDPRFWKNNDKKIILINDVLVHLRRSVIEKDIRHGKVGVSGVWLWAEPEHVSPSWCLHARSRLRKSHNWTVSREG